MSKIKWFVVGFFVLGMVACSSHKKDSATKQSKTEKKAAIDKSKIIKKVSKLKEEKKMKVDPSKVLEQKRRELVKKELDECELHVFKHSAKDLSPDEKNFVKEILAAGDLIEKLNMLMINPEDLEYEKEVEKKGTADDKELFRRNQQPWCVDITDPLCCALNPCPKKEIGAYLWPKNMTDEEFKKILNAPNKKALLSPFTIVRRDKNGGFKAIPYAEAPLFKPYLKKIAAHLMKAATFTKDKSMKTFLMMRAAAFDKDVKLPADLAKRAAKSPADSPFPYDESDYDWIALKGDWDLTIGPYEVYKNPKQIKARFEFVFGRVDKALTQALDKFRSHLQEMELDLANLVGKKVYRGRKLDPRIAIRAINVWLASGDGRNPQGALAAFHLPNRGRSVDEGLYKKVMLVNHMKAFSRVMKERAKLILDPSQQKYVDGTADVYNTTFHEFSHGFGAYDELPVTTKDGKKTTVHEALKEFSSLLEEEKADVFSLYFVEVFKKKGWINDEEAKKRYVSALMHLIGLMQYNLKGTYPRMVSVQLGWYLDHGAVTFDKKSGLLKVNFDKMPEAVRSLAKLVATIQLTGDYEGAQKLVGKYVIKQGDTYKLSPVLSQIREISKSRFAKAGIRTLTMKYEVVDL